MCHTAGLALQRRVRRNDAARPVIPRTDRSRRARRPMSAAVPARPAAATIGALPRAQGDGVPQPVLRSGVAQAILLTVVPLEALRLLGNARGVTLLYVAAGLVAVAGRFSIPFLVRLIRRRFVFTLGALPLAASAALLATDRLPDTGGRPRARHLRASPASRSPASSTCWTTSRAPSCGTSSRCASLPAPGRGRSARGSACICSGASTSPRRSPSRSPPRRWCSRCSGRCGSARTRCSPRCGGRRRARRATCGASSPSRGCAWPGRWRQPAPPGGACSMSMRRSSR